MKMLFALVFLLVACRLAAQAPRLVVPFGHLDYVTSAAFSPDGKYILTSSNDNIAKLWNIDGREILNFSGHSDGISSTAFSPDGRMVLTGSLDGTARLWNLNGREIQKFEDTTSIFPNINSVDFSPNGKLVLTGSLDGLARLWDLKGNRIQTFSDTTSPMNSVAFSPNGKFILTGSGDIFGFKIAVKLWDLNGKEIQTFSGHTHCVNNVAFSPDGKTVLTSSFDGTAKLWDLKGHEIKTLTPDSFSFSRPATSLPAQKKVLPGFTATLGDTPSYICSAIFSPDGKKVLTGSTDGIAILWDLDGKVIQTFVSHLSSIFSLAFSPDGKNVLTSSADMTAKLWDLNGREIQSDRFKSHSSDISSIAFSQNGEFLLMGSLQGTTRLYDINGHKVQTFNGYMSQTTSVAFSPNGEMVLTGSAGNTARLWDINGHEIRTFSEGEFYSKYVEFSPDGKKIIMSSPSVDFSPDGKNIIIGSTEETAKLWDLNGHEIQTFLGNKSDSTLLDFSKKGELRLKGGCTKAKLWYLNGHEGQIFSGHTFTINAVAFSPDAKTILTGCLDGTMKLWSLDGTESQTFERREGSINSVAFSPYGKMILTSSSDKTANLWDLKGHVIKSFIGHTSDVESAIFSPNGKYILTCSKDNTIKFWNIEYGKELATLTSLDSTDWVVTTPSGLFDASPGAMKLMYYVVGLEVIDLEQLKERYYEPGLLAKIMGFDKNELRNVTAFDNVALYPEIKAKVEKDQLAIQLTERNGGLGKLSLFINDKEVQEDINPNRLKDLKIDLNTFAKYYQNDTVNTFALRAYNAEGWLKSQAYELTYQPATNPAGKNIPHLYAIVVGTANYAGDRLDLRFPDLDAKVMAQVFQSTGSALFGTDHTSIRMLSTAGSGDVASKTNIQKTFADIAAKATLADVLVVYFSGHGLAYGNAEISQFYYLTKDISCEDLSDPEVRNSYTISSDEFTQWLTAIPAQKQVMILDACNAGKVVESLSTSVQKTLSPSQIRALDRMKDRTGMFILAGSAADKVSFEASPYGHGLLTYSLLQGMSGLALTDDKRVDIMRLFQYSRDQVPELAQGIGGVQVPVLDFPTDGSSFDIGIVDASVKIPLPPAKPVFIRNNFHDENYGDALHLVKALEDRLREISVKGAQAEFSYYDVSEFEKGYSIRGSYAYEGASVNVKGSLFKGDVLQGKFQVTGKKNDVPELAQLILDNVKSLAK